jgi:hypothetical protein
MQCHPVVAVGNNENSMVSKQESNTRVVSTKLSALEKLIGNASLPASDGKRLTVAPVQPDVEIAEASGAPASTIRLKSNWIAPLMKIFHTPAVF